MKIQLASVLTRQGRGSTLRAVRRPRQSERARRARQAGLSLVESAAVVGVTGLVLAAFVPTFLTQIRLSKVSEATEQLAALHGATAAYYARDLRVEGKLRRMCLPESAGPTPSTPAVYPLPVDFTDDEAVGHETWKALGLTVQDVRYSYRVEVTGPGCGPREPTGQPIVVYRAEGDLDGDGVHSMMERTAAISADQTTLKPGALLKVLQRVE